MFVNYAHRGASAYAPENTMPAYAKGLEMGANGLELDLQQTKDGAIVIFHDDTIDRKSDGSGRIKDHTYAELYAMDFGGWFSPAFAGEHIVLFEDFAKKYLGDRSITIAIELKEAGFEAEVLDIIKRYSDGSNLYISSFRLDALANMRRLDAHIRLSWLIDRPIGRENIAQLQAIGGSQICPNAAKVTPQEILLARNSGLGVRLWGVSDEALMERVFALPTEGMTVNFPDKLALLMQQTPKQ